MVVKRSGYTLLTPQDAPLSNVNYSNDQLTIRLATTDDKAFIVSLTPRLVEFNPPIWRNTAQLTATDKALLVDALRNPPPDSIIYMAQTNDEQPLGFIHLKIAVD